MTNKTDDDLVPDQTVVVDASPGAIVAATYETPRVKTHVWPYAVATVALLIAFAVTGWFLSNLTIRNADLDQQLAEQIDRNEVQDQLILDLTKTGQELYDQLNALPGVTPEAPRPQTIVGEPGEPGATGEQGPPGPVGQTGAPGPTGPQGLDGTNGTNGADGASVVGPQGPPGQTGAAGQDGATGAAGQNAYPFTFSFTVGRVTYSCTVTDPATTAICTP